jgi:hypothetical protein
MKKYSRIILFTIALFTACDVGAQYSVTDSCNALIITNGTQTRVYPKSDLTISYTFNSALSIIRTSQSTVVAAWSVSTVPAIDSLYHQIAGYLSYGCMVIQTNNSINGSGTNPLSQTTGTQTLLYAKVTLDSSQLTNLFVKPIQIIASPGTGNFIQLISTYSIYSDSVLSDSANNTIVVYGLVYGKSASFIARTVAPRNQTGTMLAILSFLNVQVTDSFINQPINFTANNSMAYDSGSTLTLYVTYQIISQ